MIWNDKSLRKEIGLSNTKIETDSYIIAQLLEHRDAITSENISKVMELLEGSFSVSILDSAENLYLIKGCNPLSVINFRDEGILVYVSTESILWRALIETSLFPRLLRGKLETLDVIDLEEGDILKVSKNGEISKHSFNFTATTASWDVAT